MSIDYKYDGFKQWLENEDGSYSPVFAYRHLGDGRTEYEMADVRIDGPEYFKLKLQGRIA